MRWLWIVMWTYLVFALHTGFAREMQIAGCVPHLMLAGLVLMTIRIPGRARHFVAAGWGIISDCLTEGRMGADVVAFVLAAYCIRCMSPRWNLESPLRAGMLSGLIVWAVIAVSTVVRMLPDGHLPGLALLGRHAAGSAIYTAVLVAAASRAARLLGRSPDRSDPAAVPTVLNKWRMLAE